MDADSRSLEVQQTPRKVAASLLNSGIIMVSAIDKATTCLLANYTVVVFTSYGYNVVKFPFDEAGLTSSMSSRYDAERNRIKYITSGGETIVGVSGRGDLFSMNLTKKADTQLSTSTTNPSKIKGAVSQPICIWSAHKDGVRSVDVGEHGSVIISTLSGAVWRRIKRVKAKDTHVAGSSEAKRKDFKFQRVPGITNIVTVRSSVFGAFAAVRKDSEVMREQVTVGSQTLWDDIAPLNCLRNFKSSEPGPKGKGLLKTWDATMLQQKLGSVAFEVLKSPDLETDLQSYLSWHTRNGSTQVCRSILNVPTFPDCDWQRALCVVWMDTQVPFLTFYSLLWIPWCAHLPIRSYEFQFTVGYFPPGVLFSDKLCGPTGPAARTNLRMYSLLRKLTKRYR
jgi:inhibitor of Bruton tyrosine kinase